MFENMSQINREPGPVDGGDQAVAEVSIEDLKMETDKIKDEIRRMLEERFEATPYHNKGHAEDAVRRFMAIIEAMREGGVEISEEEEIMGEVAVWAHDLVQVKGGNPGDSERASMEELKGLLGEMKNNGLVEGGDEKLMMEIIKATEITFGKDGNEINFSKVTPKNLSALSSPLARAMSLADMGAAGMDGSRKLQEEGDNLFRELNPGTRIDLNDLGMLDTKEDKTKALKWLEGQVVFARWRAEQFELELGDLPDKAKEKMRELFRHFGESIGAAEGRLALWEPVLNK